MSTSLICPSCQTATTFYRPPVSVCPHCQTAYPSNLREPAEAILARQAAPVPLLITVGRFMSPGVGALTLLGLLWWLTAATTTVGADFTAWDFLTEGGMGGILSGTICIVIGVGIWNERPWTRHLMIAYWLVSFAGGIGHAITVGAGSVVATLIWAAIVFLLVGWYLYDKENVVAYYKALEMRGRVGVTRAPDDL